MEDRKKQITSIHFQNPFYLAISEFFAVKQALWAIFICCRYAQIRHFTPVLGMTVARNEIA